MVPAVSTEVIHMSHLKMGRGVYLDSTMESIISHRHLVLLENGLDRDDCHSLHYKEE